MRRAIVILAGLLVLGLAGSAFSGEGRRFEKEGDLKRKTGRQKEAIEAYDQALKAYAVSGDARSRNRLLKRLSKRGRKWSKKSARKFARLHRIWKKMEELMKRANKLPRRTREPENMDMDMYDLEHQANQLKDVAKRFENQELLASSLELEGRVLAAAGLPEDEIKKYREGAEACGQGACPPKRWSLLGKAARLMKKRGDKKTAYQLLVTINAEKSSMLPKEKRRYVRSKAMNKLCKELQTEIHSSTCLNLEVAAVGYSTHRDYSRGPTHPAFPKSQASRIHDDYLPLMTRCLKRAVDSGEVERGEIVNVTWTVRNDGRAGKFRSSPSVDGLEVGTCFKKALKVFRYPRFRGQRQNISMPLRVSF